MENKKIVPWNKGKTYEELKGISWANEFKKKSGYKNIGKKSPRKGKSMVEEYGFIKAKELKERSRNKQKGKHYFQKEIICETCGKKEIVYTSIQNICKECSINKRKARRRIFNHKEENDEKQRIRHKTTKVFGKLDKGYEYHHYTDPYEYDKFFILEKGVHRWMEAHPESFVLGGLNKSKPITS